LFVERDSFSPTHITLTRLSAIESALDVHRLDMLTYPNTLEDLLRNERDDPRWNGPYLLKGMIPVDFWDNPFQYERGPDGKGYDLYSYGADGKEGGEGEAADIRNLPR
jgi:general secretion pathway protein G